MVFRACGPGGLAPRGGAWGGTPVPGEGAPEAVPGVLLVPGLAFDRRGGRLGRGGGLYDRYLAGFGGVSIGLCWEGQLVDRVPREPHDEPVDYVVTELSAYGHGRELERPQTKGEPRWK